jgi:hypothetical protein
MDLVIPQPGVIGKIMNGIISHMLQRNPGNIEWAHFILNLCKDIGLKADLREYYSETEWQQYDKEIIELIKQLPHRTT